MSSVCYSLNDINTAQPSSLRIMSELKDCPPLKYYDFKPVEHVKVCPRYTAVLGRSEDDGIGIEELDTLQLELETLLSSASRRLRALEEQRQVPESQDLYEVSGDPTEVLFGWRGAVGTESDLNFDTALDNVIVS